MEDTKIMNNEVENKVEAVELTPVKTRIGWKIAGVLAGLGALGFGAYKLIKHKKADQYDDDDTIYECDETEDYEECDDENEWI